MSTVETLRDEHARIIGVLKEFEDVLGRVEPPPAPTLFDLRIRLTHVLISHLKAEDWVLYPRLRESRDRDVAEAARRLIADVGGLATAYTTYCRQWTAQAIADDWTGYRRDSRVVIRMLRKRVEREERELYPFADRRARDAA